MIGSFDIVKPDVEEDKTLSELMKEGQFDIKVNNEKYTVYPDYTHMTKGQHEHSEHHADHQAVPAIKDMIIDQLKASMKQENNGSLDLSKVTDRAAFDQKVLNTYLKNSWQFNLQNPNYIDNLRSER